MLTNEVKRIFLEIKNKAELGVFLENYDIQARDDAGNNILHIYLKNMEQVKLPWNKIIPAFVEKGIDINARQSKGPHQRSALQMAVFMKQQDMVDYLIGMGADVNSADANGNSVLMTAVMNYRGQEDDAYYVEKLLENGADPLQENNQEATPRELAFTIENRNVRKFFESPQNKKFSE